MTTTHQLYWNIACISYLALFDIQATLCANLQVEMVSIKLTLSCDRLDIIAVMQFPPRLSLRTIVRRELRYGTNPCWLCDWCFCWLFTVSALEAGVTCCDLLERLCSTTMTCSRWWSERLMCFASCSTWPVAQVLNTLSEPARSTRFNLDLHASVNENWENYNDSASDSVQSWFTLFSAQSPAS